MFKTIKPSIYLMSLFLLSACLCTSAPDTVRIDGLNLKADTVFNANNQNAFIMEINTDITMIEGKNKLCLTYNKEKAMDIIQNQVDTSSLFLRCDKALGSKMAMSDLLNRQAISTSFFGGKINGLLAIIPKEDFIKGTVYNFILEYALGNGNKFEKTMSMRVLP